MRFQERNTRERGGPPSGKASAVFGANTVAPSIALADRVRRVLRNIVVSVDLVAEINIVIWSAADYCTLVVRGSFVVGDAKPMFRKQRRNRVRRLQRAPTMLLVQRWAPSRSGAVVGLAVASGDLDLWRGSLAILAIATGAGAAGVLNMWYDADIDI